jgi:restriction system protein
MPSETYSYVSSRPYSVNNFFASWHKYKANIIEINSFLEGVYYDGTCQNFLGSSDNKFILPQNYTLVPLDQLFEAQVPPKFPVPLDEPLTKPADCPNQYWDMVKNAIIDNNQSVIGMNQLKDSIQKKKMELNEMYVEMQSEFQAIKNQLSMRCAKTNARIIEIAHLRHPLPFFLRRKFKAVIDEDKKVLLVEFDFPDYANENFIVGVKSNNGEPKFASETLKKKLVKQCLYSLMIRAAYLAAKFRQHDLYEMVVVNVEHSWFDPATGQSRNGMIASLQAPVDHLISLDLSKLDPEACFKNLKGISTPSLQNISPIRPIFVLDKNDDRLVSNKDIDSELEAESNLAAMPWEDFEHLVAQLFEWEFSKNGIEVKVTRASRDRGVDAILFDPDPLKGGKYILQAKRYTRTVDVSAVRDLYGTVMNEGANRGIIITTSSYGPDSYEFSKDKPLSLVDGQNLLVMLQRHGKKYRIDLEEARRLNIEQ